MLERAVRYVFNNVGHRTTRGIRSYARSRVLRIIADPTLFQLAPHEERVLRDMDRWLWKEVNA
jgi:hypothetical protein